MKLYRGQPTASVREAAETRMQPWLREAIAGDALGSAIRATGRWFTDDIEIARWYVEDANGEAEIVSLEISDYVADAFRVSNMKAQPCGLDPARFSRDPEHEFMLPAHIVERASVIETYPASTKALAA